MTDEVQKPVRLFLTEVERLAAVAILSELPLLQKQAIQPILDRLIDYGASEPSSEIKQTVFTDLCDQYADYSAKEMACEELDWWAPTDYQEHVIYMANLAAEDAEINGERGQ